MRGQGPIRTWTAAVAVVASVAATGCTAAADACEGAELIADARGSAAETGDREAQVERYEQLADSFAAGAANPLTDAAAQEDGGAALAQLLMAEHPSGLPVDIADDLDERCGTDLGELPSGVTVTDGALDDGALDDGVLDDGALDDGALDDGAGMGGEVDDGAGLDGESAADG